VAGKGAAVLAIALAARNSMDIALRTAAQLAQAGEFGLVLISLAFQHALIGNDVFQVTLSAMLMSMFVAPLLIERVARLSGQMARGDWAHKALAIHQVVVAGFALDRHVIICGYGRTGQNVARFLADERIDFLALDIDPLLVKAAPSASGRVVFGSADRPEVIQAAGLARARAVVVAYPDAHSAERVVRVVRRERADVPIIVRAADDSAIEKLKQAGATEVIPEVLEGRLMIAAQLGVPVERAMARVRDVRAERYASLRRHYADHADNATGTAEQARPLP
jgi:CPA2 family monovalent cation:H+ antiporter-2